MKTVEEITTALRGKERFNYTTSTYTMIDNILVRVSNHLPKSVNLDENNEDVKKVFLIFAESNLTEREIEKHIDEDLRDYEVEYMLIDESYNFSIDEIFNFINRM